MPEWEYKILDRKTEKLLTEEQLNELGKEGWEGFGVVSTDFGNAKQVYFKRLKQ